MTSEDGNGSAVVDIGTFSWQNCNFQYCNVTGTEGVDQFNRCMRGTVNDVRYKCATRGVDRKKRAGRKGKNVGVKAGLLLVVGVAGAFVLG